MEDWECDWTYEWESECLPPDYTWCWVTDGVTVRLAMAYSNAVGGWSNDDRWEDWKESVKAWIPLEVPKPPE